MYRPPLGTLPTLHPALAPPKCMSQTDNLLHCNKLHKHIGAREGLVSPLWKIQMHNRNRRMRSFKYHNLPAKHSLEKHGGEVELKAGGAQAHSESVALNHGALLTKFCTFQCSAT